MIIKHGTPILMNPVESITDLTEGLNIVKQLIDYIETNKVNCLGLAANQIGINKNVFVILDLNKTSMKKQIFKGFVNCEIISKKQPYKSIAEGCLSIENEEFTVTRYNQITVKDSIHGEKSYYGLEAKIIQHEYDHMQGITLKEKGA